MKPTIAALTVLYHPSEENIKSILSYSNYFDLHIIINNSESNYPSITEAFNKKNCFLIDNKANLGVATALNKGAEIAINKGYQWLLTMDQDSYFENHSLEQYFIEFEKLSDQNNIAVIGPTFIKKTNQIQCEDVNSLITSGSMLHLQNFEKIGNFNDNLFIDEVDHEYCYRARLKNFKIIQLNSIFMNHSLGDTKKIHQFNSKNNTRSLHAPIRLYYIIRNSRLTKKLYKKHFPKEVKRTENDMWIRIKNNLIYGKQKTKTLYFIIRGYIDYKRNKFGKYE